MSPLPNEYWVSIGPSAVPEGDNVVSGHVMAIAVHPADADVIYVGGAEGGVWKTEDGGGTWRPLTDLQLVRGLRSGARRGTSAIASLAVDPSNPDTIYAGTGDLIPSCCLAGPSLGVFRSTDAGGIWRPIGVDPLQRANEVLSGRTVNRLVVRPGTPTAVFATTDAGFFRYQEDGSDFWERLTDGLPDLDTLGRAPVFGDLVVDPTDGRMLVAVWRMGVYRSTDPTGTQWTREQVSPTVPYSRIALAASRPTQQRMVYAGFNAGEQYWLFAQRDPGTGWLQRPSPPSEDQLDFTNALAVGQAGSDVVWVAQTNLWVASDGGRRGGLNDPASGVMGNSWTNVAGCAQPNPMCSGLDIHVDFHDVVIANPGSFQSSDIVRELVFVINDGGVVRGEIDEVGFIRWRSITGGITVGQCGSIGLDPRNQDGVVTGLWHIGTVFVDPSTGAGSLISDGDGSQARFDAGGAPSTIVYFDDNAGVDGSIDRAVTAPHVLAIATQETIFQSGPSAHWTDPYRPGHLFRLDLASGVLSRTTQADSLSAGTLRAASSWQPIEPPGKGGLTKTMAFAKSLTFDAPMIYYLGTSVGEIWRGSPEFGWELASAGSSVAVNGISVDLNIPDRLVAVFEGETSPGRVKEFVRSSPDGTPRSNPGTWTESTLDAEFRPTLEVLSITCVVVDPGDPSLRDSSTVFIGTDQGVYRARRENDGITDRWAWTRSRGMPIVSIAELSAHQGAAFGGATGVIRAATNGRGVFEMERVYVQPQPNSVARALLMVVHWLASLIGRLVRRS